MLWDMMQTVSIASPFTCASFGAGNRPFSGTPRDVFVSRRPVFGHGKSHEKGGDDRENRVRRWLHGGIVVAEATLLTGLMIVAPGTVEELGHMIEHHLAEDSPLTKYVGPAAVGTVLAVTHQAIHVALEAGFYKWGKNRAGRQMREAHSSFEKLHGYIRELEKSHGPDYACEDAGESAFVVRKEAPQAPEGENGDPKSA